MSERIDTILSRCDLEHQEQWREWIDRIPPLKFDPEWQVQIIPPFSGALVRFVVKCGKANISVYLDVFDNLGYWDGPYWEIYPHWQRDTYRCAMGETEKLLRAIRTTIRKTNQHSQCTPKASQQKDQK